MCKVVSGRLLNNTGILAWCSVMTYRGGIEEGEGEGGPGTKGDRYIYIYTYIYIYKIMTDLYFCMAETMTHLSWVAPGGMA